MDLPQILTGISPQVRKALGVTAVVIFCIIIVSCVLKSATNKGVEQEKARTVEASLKETEAQLARERAANAEQAKRDAALDQTFDELETKVENEYRTGGSALDAAFDGLSGTGDGKGKADQPAARKD
jgi:hypothetical protein